MSIASRVLLFGLILAASRIPAANVDNDIRDTAARIDYGFYTEDLGLVAAARDAVADRKPGPWTSYLQAYAAYRAAQISLALDRPAGSWIDECIGAADDAAESNETEVEANVLIAACAALAASAEPMRSVLHQRRFRRAAGVIDARERDNPRFLLMAYTSPQFTETGIRPEPRDLLRAFQIGRAAFAFPDWGEAEALTALGAARLEAGDRRGARDLIEAALLSAPDYVLALELEAEISRRVTRH